MANFNYNKVILGGRLTDTPTLKTTPAGHSVTTFSMAVNDRQNKGQFFTITAWNKTAEFVCQYFSKGSSICIDGVLNTRSYQDNTGTKRYVTEVVADNIYFVDGKNDNRTSAPVQAQPQPVQQVQPNFVEIGEDEELPF